MSTFTVASQLSSTNESLITYGITLLMEMSVGAKDKPTTPHTVTERSEFN